MKSSLFIFLHCIISMLVFAQPIKLWEAGEGYKMPESAVYDAKRNVIYVSNYTAGLKEGMAYGMHTVSKATLNGKIIKEDFVSGITTPTGICIFNDKLYIAERFGVVEFDLTTEKVSNKYYIKSVGFLNDITVAADSSIYVTVSDSNVIYKIKNGIVEQWLSDSRISRPNGILYDAGKLLVGVCSEGSLKSVDIATKEITLVAFLSKGVIDGITKCGTNYLVTNYEGSLYLVTPFGKVTEILNTRNEKIYQADIYYAKEKELILIPAIWNNKVIGYQYKP